LKESTSGPECLAPKCGSGGGGNAGARGGEGISTPATEGPKWNRYQGPGGLVGRKEMSSRLGSKQEHGTCALNRRKNRDTWVSQKRAPVVARGRPRWGVLGGSTLG